MVFVVDHFAEELLVGCFEQILEQLNIRRTESATDAVAEKFVNSLPIGCRNKFSPCTGCIAWVDINHALAALFAMATHQPYSVYLALALYGRNWLTDMMLDKNFLFFTLWIWLVLLRFSKSQKRTVSDGFVKKFADSDSVSDSQRRHYKLIYTGHQTQCLSTGGRQMRRRCTSQVIVPRLHRCNATTGQRAVRPSPDNNAEAIIISDGHPKGPDTLASRPRHDDAAPFNTALSDLHTDHSTTSSLRRLMAWSAASSLTHATSGRRHDLNLSGHGLCQTRLRKPWLRRLTPMHPARTQMSGDTSARRNTSRRTATQDTAHRQNHTPPTATRCATIPDSCCQPPPLPLQIIIWRREMMRA